jgi:hypothetical protein
MTKKAFETRVVSSKIKNGECGSLDSTEALNRCRGAAPPGQGEAESVQHRHEGNPTNLTRINIREIKE